MEQALAFGTIGLLASKVIEMLKYLRNKDMNGAFTLAAVWIAGVVSTFLAAAAKVTETLVLPGTSIPLGTLDGASLVLIGLTLTSTIGTVYDFKKALDNGDSAKQPPLLGSGPVNNA